MTMVPGYAVKAWAANGYQGDVVWPTARWYPNPPSWNTAAGRAEAVVRMCSSGAPAEMSPYRVRVGDRWIPPPPIPKRRKKAPR
jgi:hypothetical protein